MSDRPAPTPDLQVSARSDGTADRPSRRSTCDVCKKSFPADIGEDECKVHPYWDQCICASHEQDGTPACCSCQRLLPNGAGHFSENGWYFCTECCGSRVSDLIRFSPVFRDVLLFFESIEIKVEQSIPVYLVTGNVLDKFRRGGIDKKSNKIQLRGICSSEPRTFRITGYQVWGHNMYGVRTVPLNNASPQTITLVTPTQILILGGLPRLLTGSVLAHEMMHA